MRSSNDGKTSQEDRAIAHRPTIRDVATEAGVSAATVDRVLNGRSRVRESTARRVAEAAYRIGYHASGLIDRRLRPDLPELVFGFVLHKERQEFYGQLSGALERAVRDAPDIRGTALFDYSASQTPDDVAARLDAMIGRADAVAATALDHPLVTAAVERLAAAGIPVFALLSDFAQSVRVAYIGLNNLRIGRVAGWMLAATAPRAGKLAVFVGGHRWHGHELRETGFRSYLRESAPEFEVLDTLVNLETRQLTYETTLDLLDRYPDTVGLYVAGGGMEGAIAALREVRSPGEVALVVNELTRESRAGLSEGYVTMVDATPLAALTSELLDLTRTALGATRDLGRGGADASSEPVRLPSQRFLEPSIYLPESL